MGVRPPGADAPMGTQVDPKAESLGWAFPLFPASGEVGE